MGLLLVTFKPPLFIGVATIIWLVWRVVIWRRSSVDPVREAVVLTTFVWSLVVFYFTFFPMGIVLYSWFGSFNFVPFASILQLIRDTGTVLASYNIVGNLLLLAPFGIVLPLLFRRLQSLWPLTWRVAVISAAIESSQLVTRARAVDVDDVILNTAGGALGFGLYALIRRLVERRAAGIALMERVGIATPREPLRLAAVPVGLTALVTTSIMVSTLVGSTLPDGDAGIVAHALAESAGVQVLQAEIEDYAVVLLESPERGELHVYLYKKVLPGRYVWTQSGSYDQSVASGYDWGITSYNTDAGELPLVYIWGVNQVGATQVLVSGAGVDVELILPDDPFFVVGFHPGPAVGDGLGTLSYTFVNDDGTDLSTEFDHPGV